MSRTDKTKPWRVKVAEHSPQEYHDHRDGLCDLPAEPITAKWTGCRWISTSISAGVGCCARDRCQGNCCTTEYGDQVGRRARRAASREIGTLTLANDEGATRRRSAPKNTNAWCKGKPGRRHIPHLELSNRAEYFKLLHPGRDYCQFTTGTQPRWLCTHQVSCTVCGKILRTWLPAQDCPIWQSQH